MDKNTRNKLYTYVAIFLRKWTKYWNSLQGAYPPLKLALWFTQMCCRNVHSLTHFLWQPLFFTKASHQHWGQQSKDCDLSNMREGNKPTRRMGEAVDLRHCSLLESRIFTLDLLYLVQDIVHHRKYHALGCSWPNEIISSRDSQHWSDWYLPLSFAVSTSIRRDIDVGTFANPIYI